MPDVGAQGALMPDDTIDAGFDEVMKHPEDVWKPPALVENYGQPPALIENYGHAITLPELTPTELAKLAREIAMNIKEVPAILQHYKLSAEQYDHLKTHNEFFKQALHAVTIEWNSALTTPDRIKLNAAAILEDNLLRLGSRMGNQAEGLPGVVETAKLFAKIAGVGEREGADRAPGEKFSIIINLGADDKLTYKSPESPATISIDTAGTRDDSAVE